MTRIVLPLGFALALLSAGSFAQVRPEIDPPDPSPSELPAAPGEAVPGKSIRPTPSTSVDPGTPMDRKQPQTSSDGKDGSQKAVIRTSLTKADQKSLMAVGQIAMTEIQAGQIALDRSKDSAVREFARMMVTDHGKSYARVQDIAKRESVDVSTLDAKHAQMLAELRGAPLEGFDKAYVGSMVRGHQDAMATIEAVSRKSDDAELKAYAADTLVTVRMHLEHARKLEATLPKTLKASGSQ